VVAHRYLFGPQRPGVRAPALRTPTWADVEEHLRGSC
jgi:hypothetical protein